MDASQIMESSVAGEDPVEEMEAPRRNYRMDSRTSYPTTRSLGHCGAAPSSLAGLAKGKKYFIDPYTPFTPRPVTLLTRDMMVRVPLRAFSPPFFQATYLSGADIFVSCTRRSNCIFMHVTRHVYSDVTLIHLYVNNMCKYTNTCRHTHSHTHTHTHTHTIDHTHTHKYTHTNTTQIGPPLATCRSYRVAKTHTIP